MQSFLIGQGTVFRKVLYAQQKNDLDSACQWLEIERGRAAQYGKLLKEFYEDDKRCREHILAYAESCEIVDLFKLWHRRIADFPGVKAKIRDAFRKGPLLCEDERPKASSNRARNDAFGCLLAGMFLKAGIPVIAVEGIHAHHATCRSEHATYHSNSDFIFEWGGSLIDVECKRLRSDEQLVKRVKKGREQITSNGERHGVIALDCSVLVRPAEHLLEHHSPDAAESQISLLLEKCVLPKVKPCLIDSILGYVLFARVPAMIRLGNGELRRDCVLSWLVVSNSQYAGDPGVLRTVAKRLDEGGLPS